MKKFTFKGVLDGFRSSPQPVARGQDQEIQETLRSDHFLLKKVSGERFRPRSPARFRTQRANGGRARTKTKQTEPRPDPYSALRSSRCLFSFRIRLFIITNIFAQYLRVRVIVTECDRTSFLRRYTQLHHTIRKKFETLGSK